MQEHVLVFPVALLDKLGRFQGLHFDVERYLEPILANCDTAFMLREDAERDTTHKQLIPYVIVRHAKTVLVYRRGKLLAEDRLRGCYSVGIGGHISSRDPRMFDRRYEDAALRELTEELDLQGTPDLRRVALINDDSDAVGRVHFGIVYVLMLREPVVHKREKSINEPSFLPIGELSHDLSRFESWSQICITQMDFILARAGDMPPIAPKPNGLTRRPSGVSQA
jgi:predicted NUDIX family phosphoesterase